MNTRSSTRSDPSKASGSADGPAEPTHSEVHVERPQDLASPAYAPRTDAATAPHDNAPSNSTPCDNPPHATVPSTSHNMDRNARLNAMIAAAADKAFTLACEEEQLDDSPASQERKNRILAEIERLNNKRHELTRLMEQPAIHTPSAAPIHLMQPKLHSVPGRHQFCQLHGLGSHATEQCRSLQARKIRANPGPTDVHFERPPSSSATRFRPRRPPRSPATVAAREATTPTTAA